nr:MAG TPA: hypothetical protein [Caudoviricetes sp.]
MISEKSRMQFNFGYSLVTLIRFEGRMEKVP